MDNKTAESAASLFGTFDDGEDVRKFKTLTIALKNYLSHSEVKQSLLNLPAEDKEKIRKFINSFKKSPHSTSKVDTYWSGGIGNKEDDMEIRIDYPKMFISPLLYTVAFCCANIGLVLGIEEDYKEVIQDILDIGRFHEYVPKSKGGSLKIQQLHKKYS